MSKKEKKNKENDVKQEKNKKELKKKIKKDILALKSMTVAKTNSKKITNNNGKKLTQKDKFNKILHDIDNIIKKLDEPTLILISNGIGQDNRIRMEMKWNDAFIKNVNRHGIVATTEEETAMLFLVGCQLKPEEFPGHDEEVVSDAHPLLSTDTILKR